jgi:alpha-tubulin suppressor-like RCC1 family protein
MVGSNNGSTVVSAAVRMSDGSVMAWGGNSLGQLGNGKNDTVLVPEEVVCGELAGDATHCSLNGKLQGVDALSGSSDHLVALLSNGGGVVAWGNGQSSQLGAIATATSNTPVRVNVCEDASGMPLKVTGVGVTCTSLGGTVTPLVGATAVAANGGTAASVVSFGASYAIKNGMVLSWGNNAGFFELGIGDTSVLGLRYPAPVVCGEMSVEPAFCNNGVLTNVTAIAAGSAHVLARLSDGRVVAWGSGSAGQLGNGANVAHASPVLVKAVDNLGPALIGVVEIAANANHSLARLSDMTMAAWGDGGFGALGIIPPGNKNSPVRVQACKNGTAFVPLPLGGSCLAPNTLGNLDNVTAIAAGVSFNMAILSDSTVAVWGANPLGALSDGTTINRPTAVRARACRDGGSALIGFARPNGTAGSCASQGGTLSDLTGVTRIAGTSSMSLFLSNGELLAAGSNGTGQHGDGTQNNVRTMPVPVRSCLNGAGVPIRLPSGATCASIGGTSSPFLSVENIRLTAGAAHALAVSPFNSTPSLWAWGANSNGQFGDSTTNSSAAPFLVPDTELSPDTAVVLASQASSNNSYALVNEPGLDGVVFAWGANTFGQVGDGTATQRTSPVDVRVCVDGGAIVLAPPPGGCAAAGGVLTTLDGVTAIAAGGLHALALVDGKVLGWGSGGFGQLGHGGASNLFSAFPARRCLDGGGNPIFVPFGVTCASLGGTLQELTGVKAIGAGSNASYAVISDDTVLTYGNGAAGALGSSAGLAVTPIAVVCGELANSAFCTLDGRLRGVTAIAGGNNYAIALLEDGGLVGWGANETGQLGNATTGQSPAPVRVVCGEFAGTNHCSLDGRLIGVAGIATGLNSTYAYWSDGSIASWGANSHAQLGDGNHQQRSTPGRVKICRDASTDAVIEVALNGGGSCEDLGGVVSDLTGVTQIAAGGSSNALARLLDGQVVTWGSNNQGQLGVAVDPTAYATPGKVVLELRWGQTIHFDPLANRKIAESPVIVSATGGGSGNPVTFTTSTPLVCTAGGTNGATLALIAVGTCTVQADQLGNDSYLDALPVIQSFLVGNGKVDQTIQFDPISPKTLEQSPLAMTATASSGLPVSFTTLSPAVCSTSGQYGITVTLLTPGMCTIEAAQVGNSSYNAAPAVDQSFPVIKKGQFVTFNAADSATIPQSPLTMTATASSGLAVTFTSMTTAVCTTTGQRGATLNLLTPGTCTIRADQAGSAVYEPAPSVTENIAVSKAAQVITFAPLPNRTLSQSPFTVAASSTSGLAVTFSSLTPSVCTTSAKNGSTVKLLSIGTCSIQAAQPGNAGFEAAVSVVQPFSVTP